MAVHALRARAALPLIATTLACCSAYRPNPFDAAAATHELATRSTSGLRTSEARSRLDPAWFPVAGEANAGDGVSYAEALGVGLSFAPRVSAARGRWALARAAALGAGQPEDPQFFLGPRLGLEDGGFVLPGGMSWQVPLGDRLPAERGVACATLEHARLEWVAEERLLCLDVREAYVRLATLARKVAVVERAAKRSRVLMDQAKARQSAGETGAIGALLARLEHDDLSATGETLRADEARTRYDLFARIGLLANPALSIDLAGELPLAHPAAIARATATHPDLLLAASALQLEEQHLREAVALKSPTLSIGPEIELDRGEFEVGAGIEGTIPLSRRHAARIAMARTARDNAYRRYQDAVVELAAREASAQSRFEAASRRLQDQAERSAASAEAESALDGLIAAGAIDVLEALATEGAVARARLREADAEQELSLAAQALADARGHLEATTPVEGPR